MRVRRGASPEGSSQTEAVSRPGACRLQLKAEKTLSTATVQRAASQVGRLVPKIKIFGCQIDRCLTRCRKSFSDTN